MKKFLTSAGLVAIGVSNLQAYDPGLTPIEASKPWSISAALRGFYDDNITGIPKNFRTENNLGVTEIVHPVESFGYEINPSVSLNLPLDQTYFGVSYEYSFKYYENRRSTEKYDQAHLANLRLDHAFSERYKVKIDDSFAVSNEPEVLAPSTGVTTDPLRTDSNNIRNLGSIRFTAQMTELLALELAYANTFYNYGQNDGTAAEPSRAGLLDRLEHLASLDLRWQAMPDTDIIFGYAYGLIDYTGDEIIGTGIVSDDRNNQSHRVIVGVDHRFNAQLSGSVRIGGQYTDYYNADSDNISPYADANLTYLYNRGNTIQVGILHSRNPTDVLSLDQETTLLYGSINHKITPNLVGSLLAQGQYSTFNDGSANGDNEIFFVTGLNLTYHFNPFFLAEAGYNFDRLDSDLPNRSYSRNRFYVGVRATY